MKNVLGAILGVFRVNGLQHDFAQAARMVPQRNEIPIGERREQATRNAFRDPHHDQPPALVQRIMADGAERLGHAVIALEIGWRKKGDDARAAVERGLHALHEITVRKIPVLQGDAIARAFEDAADHCGKMRIRAGPRNKEMRFSRYPLKPPLASPRIPPPPPPWIRP